MDKYILVEKRFLFLISIVAWTTAAVDNTRVVGAIPLVMDLLNLRPVIEKQLLFYFPYFLFVEYDVTLSSM